MQHIAVPMLFAHFKWRDMRRTIRLGRNTFVVTAFGSYALCRLAVRENGKLVYADFLEWSRADDEEKERQEKAKRQEHLKKRLLYLIKEQERQKQAQISEKGQLDEN